MTAESEHQKKLIILHHRKHRHQVSTWHAWHELVGRVSYEDAKVRYMNNSLKFFIKTKGFQKGVPTIETMNVTKIKLKSTPT